jgi:hypothetical protein
MSVAQDSELRRSIKRSAEDQAGILKEIGASQMENEIRKRIKTVTQDLLAKSERWMNKQGFPLLLEKRKLRNTWSK